MKWSGSYNFIKSQEKLYFPMYMEADTIKEAEVKEKKSEKRV